jgi:hypothetical protein
MRFLFLMFLGLALFLGGFVSTRGGAATPTREQLGQAFHNLWHPDYP